MPMLILDDRSNESGGAESPLKRRVARARLISESDVLAKIIIARLAFCHSF